MLTLHPPTPDELYGLGNWPDMSLANARKERDKAREALAAGADPARKRQQAKHLAKIAAANTFGEIAQEFIDKRRQEGMSASTADKSEYYIKRMGPVVARMPIAEITAPDLLVVLRRIIQRARGGCCNWLAEYSAMLSPQHV